MAYYKLYNCYRVKLFMRPGYNKYNKKLALKSKEC